MTRWWVYIFWLPQQIFFLLYGVLLWKSPGMFISCALHWKENSKTYTYLCYQDVKSLVNSFLLRYRTHPVKYTNLKWWFLHVCLCMNVFWISTHTLVRTHTIKTNLSTIPSLWGGNTGCTPFCCFAQDYVYKNHLC